MSLTASSFGTVAADQAVAGFTAGLVSTLVCHPLDVIKIRLQGQSLRILSWVVY